MLHSSTLNDGQSSTQNLCKRRERRCNSVRPENDERGRGLWGRVYFWTTVDKIAEDIITGRLERNSPKDDFSPA
jgi:REP element-mobilizing transposase RayT